MILAKCGHTIEMALSLVVNVHLPSEGARGRGSRGLWILAFKQGRTVVSGKLLFGPKSLFLKRGLVFPQRIKPSWRKEHLAAASVPIISQLPYGGGVGDPVQCFLSCSCKRQAACARKLSGCEAKFPIVPAVWQPVTKGAESCVLWTGKHGQD